jgi:maltodextrin utilization protein YvdJ
MTKLQMLSDKLAIGFSMVCVVHCLVLPILLILLPPFSGLFALDDEMFHQWMLCEVLPISIAALIMGYLHHRSYKVFLVGSIGLTLIIISTTLGHDVLGKTGEVVVSILGSMSIAYGHFRNYQLISAKHETQ